MSAPVAPTPRIAGGSLQGTRQQLDELDALLQRMLSLPVNQAEEPTRPSIEEESPSIPPEPARISDPPPRAMTPPSQRGYPASYMVVESASLPSLDPSSAGGVGSRRLGTSTDATRPYSFPSPVPGGKHVLVEDTPIDPIVEAARAQLAMPEQEGDWVPLQSSWQPSAQTWKPLAETWEHSRGSTPPAANLPEPPMMPRPRAVPEMSPWNNNVIPPPPPGYLEIQESWFEMAQPTSPIVSEARPGADSPPVVPIYRTPLVLAPLVWFNRGFDLLLLPFGPLGRLWMGPSGRTVLGNLGLLCLAGAIVLAIVEGFGWTR